MNAEEAQSIVAELMAAGLAVEEIAYRAGVSYPTARNWRDGKGDPQRNNAEALEGLLADVRARVAMKEAKEHGPTGRPKTAGPAQ